MKKNIENYIRDHCEIVTSKITGEELIMSPLSMVMEAFNEYAKDLKASLEYDDFGFGDSCGDVSDKPTQCQTGSCRRPDKSI